MMLRYTLEDATLQLPKDFRVAFVVTASPAPGETFASNLVISRDRFRPGEEMSTYLDRQLLGLAKSLKKFKLHARRAVNVGGVPGHEISCAWFGSQGPLEQRLTFVEQGSGDDRRVLTFTTTVTKTRADELLPQFEQIVHTARLP